MKHLQLFEAFQPVDIFMEGFEKAWEDYKKVNTDWNDDEAVEVALSFYKDPDDAEKAAMELLDKTKEN